MKKILSVLLVALMLISMLPATALTAFAAEETATLSFASTANRVSQDSNKQVWSQNGITFTNNKAGSSNAVANYSNPVRLYQKSQVIIEAPGNITQIVFDCNASKYVSPWVNSIGTTAKTATSGNFVTVTLDGTSNTFTVDSLTAQVRFNSFTVTYIAGADAGCEHANLGDPTHENGKHIDYCNDCQQNVASTETVTVEKTATQHITTCTCGYTDAADHTFTEHVCTECGYIETFEGTFTKVTNVSELEVGSTIVIIAADYNTALSTNQANNNRVEAAVVKDGDNATIGYNVQLITLEAGASEGTFAFNVGTGYLYAAGNTDGNYLRTQGGIDGNASWLITIDEEGATSIVAQGSNARNVLQYNQSSKIFACYGSASQKAVVIYKLQGACTHESVYATTETTHTATCGKCGVAMGVATFHDMNGENGKCSVCDYAVDAATLVKALVEATVALENQEKLGNFTLTGEIVSVDTAYSEEYGNITVTIKIGESTIKCYRLAGEGVATLGKTDVITVSGSLQNYNGTAQFATGSQLVAIVEKHTCEYEYAPATIGCIGTCTICGAKTEDTEHVDANTDDVCDNCSADIGCAHNWVVSHEDGKHVVSCSECRVEDPTEFVISQQTDDEYHWTACSCGKYETEKIAHTYVEGKCECGKAEPLDLTGKFQKVDTIGEGYYVIGGTANYTIDGTNFVFMSGETDGSNRQMGVAMGIVDGVVSTTEQIMIWEFIAAEGGYKIRNAATLLYLYFDSSATKNLIHLTDDESLAGIWNVYSDEKQWTLQDTVSKRYLAAVSLGSNTYLGFSSYANLQSRSIELYAAVPAEQPHEHSYEEVVTAPTCVAAGYTTYTCSCGDTYTGNEVPATGEHTYVDGVCTGCGAAEVVVPTIDENLTIVGKDMLLGGYIGAQFTVNPEATGAYDSVYIVVVFDGLEYTYEVPLYEGAHVFEHRVAPKYMGEALQITAYGVKGEEVIPGVTVEWSIKDGIMERLAKFYPYIKHEVYKNRCILLVDMLYYGAEAQVRFGTNGNGLVTDGLDEGYAALKTATEPTIEKVNTATQTASNQLYQVNLGVEDAVQMQFTFRLKVEDYSQYVVKITANGTTYEYTGESFIPQGDTSTLKKFVTVVFDKLEAVNMRDEITVELWQNGALVSASYTMSIEGFATASIAKGENVALLKSMIAYGDSAKVSLG